MGWFFSSNIFSSCQNPHFFLLLHLVYERDYWKWVPWSPSSTTVVVGEFPLFFSSFSSWYTLVSSVGSVCSIAFPALFIDIQRGPKPKLVGPFNRPFVPCPYIASDYVLRPFIRPMYDVLYVCTRNVQVHKLVGFSRWTKPKKHRITVVGTICSRLGSTCHIKGCKWKETSLSCPEFNYVVSKLTRPLLFQSKWLVIADEFLKVFL